MNDVILDLSKEEATKIVNDKDYQKEFIKKETERLLSYFVVAESKDFKDIPELKYSDHSDGDSISKFSLEYIKPFIDILNITDEVIEIKVKKDYPITLENKDFIIIVAPRVEEED